MQRRPSSHTPAVPRSGERGNIVLIAALIVLALGMSAVGLSRFVQVQMNTSSERRLTNFAGTYAQNVAESEINYLLFAWDTASTGSNTLAPYVATYSSAVLGNGLTQLQTTYSPQLQVTSTATYAVTTGAWSASSPATISVTAAATASSLTSGASPAWQTIARQVTVTVASTSAAGAPFTLQAYAR